MLLYKRPEFLYYTELRPFQFLLHSYNLSSSSTITRFDPLIDPLRFHMVAVKLQQPYAL